MKLIQLFESKFPTSREEVEDLCKKYKIESYTINEDLSIDVNEDVKLQTSNLTSLPIKFRFVSGTFNCSNNQLISLEGAPLEVGGSFSCSGNQLTSLKGAPREVGGNFYCSDNELTSLKGAPREVGGNFYCSDNELTSLEGSPREVGADFYCTSNQLTSLEGAPREVGGDFECQKNPDLKSLDGIGNVAGEIISDVK